MIHAPSPPIDVAAAVIGTLLLLASGSGGAHAADVTVAFVGDHGTHQGARDVLALIAANDVDLLVSGGDLGYSRGADAWIANVDEILGADFPVLAVVGNHESEDWPAYRRWLQARVDAVDELACDGEIGVKAHCSFRGISIVQSAPGVHEVPGVSGDDDYAGYLARELAADPNVWRICSWHKLQEDMQVGSKNTDSTGWGVYEACREGGGIVATAHEHSYSRTHLLSDFSEKRIVHENDHLEIGPGRTFAFVSGLGGQSVRPQLTGGDWWASIYTASQQATHGALFCTFGRRTADCRFEDIAGGVPDRFTLESLNPPAAGPVRSGMLEAAAADSPAADSPAADPEPDIDTGALEEPAGIPSIALARGTAAESADATTVDVAFPWAAESIPGGGGGGAFGLLALAPLAGVLRRRRRARAAGCVNSRGANGSL